MLRTPQASTAMVVAAAVMLIAMLVAAERARRCAPTNAPW
jgi:hypothetical protein